MSWKTYQWVTIVTYMFRKCVTILKTRMWILVFLWPFQLYWNQHLSNKYRTCCCCSVAKSCPTLCDPKSYSPPGSFVHGILQARIRELVTISFSRGSFQPRDRTQVSCIGRGVPYHWATRAEQDWAFVKHEAEARQLTLEETEGLRAKGHRLVNWCSSVWIWMHFESYNSIWVPGDRRAVIFVWCIP